jgi:hypothetical protein
LHLVTVSPPNPIAVVLQEHAHDGRIDPHRNVYDFQGCLLSTLALAANQRKVLLQFADKGAANPPAI